MNKLVYIFVSFLLAISAQAQAISPELAQKIQQEAETYQITEADQEAYAKSIGLDPKSRFLNREPGFVNKRLEEIRSTKIIKHIRGKQGVEFTSIEALKEKIKIDENVKKQILQNVKNIDQQVIDRMLKGFKRVIKLPKCSKDGTEKILAGEHDPKEKPVVFSDILFIEEKDIPSEPFEKIGKNVAISIYNQEKATSNNWAALGMGVKCLPTRIRSTSSYLFIDTGSNTLRNYDNNYNQEGILHESLR